MLSKFKPLIIILAILLFIIATGFIFISYGDIKNTFKQPDLVINNAEDLKDFSNKVGRGESFKDKLVVLNNDINFNIEEENNFKPIGKIEINPLIDDSASPDYSNYFQGTFDGKNHTISGINISINEGDYVGLFSRLALESEVRNLKLKDSIIENKRASNVRVGSIVGYIGESKIINCYSNAILNIYTIDKNNSIGGIVGSIYRSEVSNCCFEGTINIDTYLETHGASVGGVAGNNGEFSKIVNCYNNGNSNINILDEHPSEIKLKSDYQALCVGGLVGSNNPGVKAGAYLINSYYTGTINFNLKENTNNIPALKVGGIAGCNQYVIENCYNAGQINNYSGYVVIADCVGSYNSIKATSCYYLDTINAPEINTIIPSEVEPNPQIDIQKLTSEEMKSKEFIEKLNEKAKEQREIRVQDSSFPWKYRTKTSSWYIDNKINDGYPILSDVNYGG